MSVRTRRAATAASILALGAGGGAGTAILIRAPAAQTATVTQAAAGSVVSDVTTTGSQTVNDIYRSTRQSVVDIKDSSGEGSGFVLNRNGDIVTNEHVVGGASSIEVTFSDGTKAPARVVGTDASTDVAVIHVDVAAAKLHPLTLADSSKVQVGDAVVAIGSPYGLEGSVTTGIVSALGRSITSPSGYAITGALQTDAAINPGNSGGPLINAAGDVVGMNAQIESTSQGNTGVGFAIPSSTVSRVAQQLAAGQKVQHAYLGVQLSDTTGGAKIGSVRSGSPAEAAGLRSGDVVVAVDGRTISSADAAIAAFDAKRPGDKVSVTFQRAGAARQSVDVTLGTRPS